MNVELAPVVQMLPQAQQDAWLGMAVVKNSIVAELTQAELNAQSLLVVDATQYAAIDGALANYRKAHTEMVELRKGFTNQIEKGITQPLMAFEKRVDPSQNEVYQRLAATSLSLRKAETNSVSQTNQINAEIAQFKAHCANEFFRVAAAYRTAIRAEITNQYTFWLNEGAAPDMVKLRVGLELIEIPAAEKFKPVLLTKEQMTEAYATLHQPDYSAIFSEMMEEMDNTFANFKSDLANKPKAIARQQEASKLANLTDTKQAIEEAAINTLIVTSEAVIIDTPKIKQTLTITIVESEAWAKTIMAGFIANMPAMVKYIRVKSWANLSIGQMAEYLGKLATETEIKINGVEYASVER